MCFMNSGKSNFRCLWFPQVEVFLFFSHVDHMGWLTVWIKDCMVLKFSRLNHQWQKKLRQLQGSKKKTYLSQPDDQAFIVL